MCPYVLIMDLVYLKFVQTPWKHYFPRVHKFRDSCFTCSHKFLSIIMPFHFSSHILNHIPQFYHKNYSVHSPLKRLKSPWQNCCTQLLLTILMVLQPNSLYGCSILVHFNKLRIVINLVHISFQSHLGKDLTSLVAQWSHCTTNTFSFLSETNIKKRKEKTTPVPCIGMNVSRLAWY